MPSTEPNSLPPVFDDWQDWRRAYASYVEEFKSRASVNETMLTINLKRLGFVGVNLDREIESIKEYAHK